MRDYNLYFNDIDIIWDVLKNKLPELKQVTLKIQKNITNE